MKKLLYITASSKPENLSTSKTVGRDFVNKFIEKNKDFTVEELDLCTSYIPDMTYKIFQNRAEVVTGDAYNALGEEDKKAVDRINDLCNQFISADFYVIAAPMWGVSFPSIVKKYVDCIMMNGKLISITPDEVNGLLNDKKRDMVYIQSSGGVYPKIFSSKFNHGVAYFHDIFKFLGIDKFEKILVEGVDTPSVGKDEAVSKATEDVNSVVNKLTKEPTMV